MAFSVQMPALGESVTEGTVTRWLKKEGDTVEADEPLLEVSTDKVDTEIPSPASGVLTKILAGEDAVVEVGGELGLIGNADEATTPAPQTPQPPTPQVHQPPTPAVTPTLTSPGTTVSMPELGESVTEGTVTRWLKKEGDTVEADEPLVEVSTDKVDTEIPSPATGTLLEISADTDTVVVVGGKLGVIGVGAPTAAPTSPAPAPDPVAMPTPAAGRVPTTPERPAVPTGNGEVGPYVTPLVRKLAVENNVDLSSIKGSGVGGRIRKQDVLAAAEASKPASATPTAGTASSTPEGGATARPEPAGLRGTTQKANRIRQITAAKTRESLQTTAQLTQVHEADVTRIAALRAKTKTSFAERAGVNLTFLPFFAKAAVEALGIHPNINASYDEETREITYHADVHLGIAVDTDQGLLSPVVHNAGDLSLAGLARAIADIADRARRGALKPDDLVGGTFTITNIGSQGALLDTPILVPPQAAMLGTGAVVKRPTVITDESGTEAIGIRWMCYLPLTYDHRLIDGADAGRFLTTIRHRLEEAAFEADLGL